MTSEKGLIQIWTYKKCLFKACPLKFVKRFNSMVFNMLDVLVSERAVSRYSLKHVFTFHKLHKKTTVYVLKTRNFKRLQHRCFPVKFEKFLRKCFFREHLRWLLLKRNEKSFYQVLPAVAKCFNNSAVCNNS